MKLPIIEPYKTKMVELVYQSTKEEREKWIADSKRVTSRSLKECKTGFDCTG